MIQTSVTIVLIYLLGWDISVYVSSVFLVVLMLVVIQTSCYFCTDIFPCLGYLSVYLVCS